MLLQKTLIHIEAMGRQIYPDLDFWGIAEPYLDNWLSEQFSPLKLKDYIVENKELYKSLDKDVQSYTYLLYTSEDADEG